MTTKNLTHDVLRELAFRLVIDNRLSSSKYSKKLCLKINPCVLAVSEVTVGLEIPDVFGVGAAGETILIECKASKSDFNIDAKKAGRHLGVPPNKEWWYKYRNFNPDTDYGIGQKRYYMVPPGLIASDTDTHGFGILEAHHHKFLTKVKLIKESKEFNPHPQYQLEAVIRLLNAFGTPNVSHKVNSQLFYFEKSRILEQDPNNYRYSFDEEI
jgi:hypothetical protein